MGYLKIPNLYKDETMLVFRWVYVMEKIHGTSAHVSYKAARNPPITYFAGGTKHEAFVALFDEAVLLEAFTKLGVPEVVVYGEAYGGKCQGMRDTYGDKLRFTAFEVTLDDMWLDVPNAEEVAHGLGFEFVWWERRFTDVNVLDEVLKRPSEQAKRCGIEGNKPMEGVVLRPPVEVRLNNGQRMLAKHKNDAFRETKTPRKVGQPAPDLAKARALAEEWVTEMRVSHVLDAFASAQGVETDEALRVENIGKLISAMVDDVIVEAGHEAVIGRDAKRAISRRTALLVKGRITRRLHTKGEPQ